MPNIIPVKAIPGGGSATALGEFNPGDVVDPAFLPPSVIDDSIADIEEEGVSTGGGPYSIIDFVGIATAVDAGGGKATVTIPDTNVDTLALTDVEEEGGSLGGPFSVLNFVGIGTVVDSGGGKATLTIPDTNTDTLALTDILEEGGSLGGPFGAINFVGIGTAVDSGGGLCTVTIPDTNVNTIAIADLEEESVSLGGGPYSVIDFIGIGTIVDSGGGKATLTIPDTNTDVAIGDVETDGVTTGGGPYSVMNFQDPLVATDAGGGQVDISLGGVGLLQGVVFPGQWGYMSAFGKGAGKGGTTLSGSGLLDDVEGVDNADSVTASATGVALIQLSDGLNNFQLASRLAEPILRYDNGILMIQKFALLGTTTVRYFCGLFDDGAAEPTDTDNIGGQGVGIVFSTSRPDTNFQFVAHTGGAQALVDSAVAIDGVAHCLVVRRNAVTPANYDVELRSGDFLTLQASTTFTAAQLGAATNPLKLGLYAKALSGVVISQAHYHVSVVLEGV